MRRVLVLGEMPPIAALHGEAIGGADCTVVSVSPWLDEQLDEAGVASRPAARYAVLADWDAIHARLARVLAPGGRAAIARAPWWDDWSHFLADEARGDLYWAHVARRIVERECPARLFLQRVAAHAGAAGSLAALAAAFTMVGQPWTYWEPRQ
jgi:hypothetical protein